MKFARTMERGEANGEGRWVPWFAQPGLVCMDAIPPHAARTWSRATAQARKMEAQGMASLLRQFY